jgi:hypothetical protein
MQIQTLIATIQQGGAVLQQKETSAQMSLVWALSYSILSGLSDGHKNAFYLKDALCCCW